jgi:hypothetical protein
MGLLVTTTLNLRRPPKEPQIVDVERDIQTFQVGSGGFLHGFSGTLPQATKQQISKLDTAAERTFQENLLAERGVIPQINSHWHVIRPVGD